MSVYLIRPAAADCFYSSSRRIRRARRAFVSNLYLPSIHRLEHAGTCARLAPLPNGTRFATRHLDARVELGRAWVRVTALLRGGRHAKAAGSAWRAGTSSLARRADTGELARPIDGTSRIFHAFSVGLRNTHATRDTRHGRARRTRRARRAFESLRAHHPVRAIRIRLPSSIGRRYANRASETRPGDILPPLAPTPPSLRKQTAGHGRVGSYCRSRADVVKPP